MTKFFSLDIFDMNESTGNDEEARIQLMDALGSTNAAWRRWAQQELEQLDTSATSNILFGPMPCLLHPLLIARDTAERSEILGSDYHTIPRCAEPETAYA